jgi:hypothetical protein
MPKQKSEAETPEQALERVLEMAEDKGGNLLDSLGDTSPP